MRTPASLGLALLIFGSCLAYLPEYVFSRANMLRSEAQSRIGEEALNDLRLLDHKRADFEAGAFWTENPNESNPRNPTVLHSDTEAHHETKRNKEPNNQHKSPSASFAPSYVHGAIDAHFSKKNDHSQNENPENVPIATGDEPSEDSPHPPVPKNEGETELSEAYVVFFIIVALLIGALCTEFKKMTGLPFTPMLLVIGIVIGAYAHHFGELGIATDKVLEINPHGILLIFIPTLIFESAYNIDPFIVKKEFVQIIVLAVPGVAIGAVIIGIILNLILGYSMEFPFSAGLTIASIICATDPVAVVALLKEVGAPAKFSTLLEGESLLNDGTAMVFFIIFSSIYKSLGLTWYEIALKFVQLTVGGVLLGVVAGLAVLFWIKKIIKDDILTANLTITTCYLTFFVGEFFLGVSGIISIVTLGVLMGNLGKVTMNPESLESIHTILSYLQHILETLLFVLTGCFIGRSSIGGGLQFIWTSDVIRVILFFPLMTGARWLMLMMMKPFLNRWGWPVDKTDIIVLTYGGLRGSIALCLALMVAVDEDYSQRFRELCLFFVICMITFTVLINGLTMKWVMRKVNFYPKTEAEKKIKMNLRQRLIVEAFLNKSLITENSFLRLANWDAVIDLAGVKTDLEEINKKKRKGGRPSLENFQNDSIRISVLPKEAITEARLRVYHQIKANLWTNFEESLCSTNAMSSLREIIDICMTDIKRPVWIWVCISENFISHEWIQLLGSLNAKPIIGYFSKRFLMTYLLNAYEILFNLVLALADVFHKKDELLVTKELISEVLREVQSNLDSCEEYLFTFITLFQDLAVIIQLRQSAKIILNKQKEVLKTALHNGSISQNEFVKLKGKLDKRIRSLEIRNVSYELPVVHPLKLVCPTLVKLSGRSFELLAEKYTEDSFAPGTKILVKGKQTQVVYIVSSGFCVEEYDNKTLRKGMGSVFSFSNIVNSQQLATNNVTAGDDTRVFCIQNRVLLEVMNQEPEFEKDVYTSAFLKLMKNNKDLSVYTDTQDFHNFVQKAKLEKIRVNQRVLLDKGGFLFSGELVVPNADAELQSKATVEESELIAPSASDYLATKMSVIFKFDTAIIGTNPAVTAVSLDLNDQQRVSFVNLPFQPRETLADIIKRETDAEAQYQVIEQQHLRK